MAVSRKGRRRIVVNGRLFWWSYRYVEDWAAGFFVADLSVVADDGRFGVLAPQGAGREPVVWGARDPDAPPAERPEDPGVLTPAYVRAVIAWGLSAPSSAPRSVEEPEGLPRMRGPLFSRAMGHAAKALAAPDASSLLVVPANPARARAKRRAAIERAWESVAAAGVLPMSWMDEPRRWFAYERSATCAADAPWIEPEGCPEVALVTRPPTVRAAVLAADMSGELARAEELAREFCARARPFGVPSPERVAWWFEGDLRLTPRTHPRPALALFEALDEALRARRVEVPLPAAAEGRRVRVGAVREARDDDRALATIAPYAEVSGLFEARGDPWAPLLALWEMGCGLLAVDDDAIWLWAQLA